VIKKVDPPVDFHLHPIEVEGKTIYAIRIPPSSKKPHVIREYVTFKNGEQNRREQNRIFVRKNTQIQLANKYDLDLMYYDRGNAFPDFDLDISLRMKFMVVRKRGNGRTEFKVQEVFFGGNFIIENTGRRPVYIDDLRFQFENPEVYPGDVIFFGFDKAKELIVNPKEIKRFTLTLNKNNLREESLPIFDKRELQPGSNFEGIVNPKARVSFANENKMTFPVRLLGWIKESVPKVI
jgi:hypothetical protein